MSYSTTNIKGTTKSRCLTFWWRMSTDLDRRLAALRTFQDTLRTSAARMHQSSARGCEGTTRRSRKLSRRFVFRSTLFDLRGSLVSTRSFRPPSPWHLSTSFGNCTKMLYPLVSEFVISVVWLFPVRTRRLTFFDTRQGFGANGVPVRGRLFNHGCSFVDWHSQGYE